MDSVLNICLHLTEQVNNQLTLVGLISPPVNFQSKLPEKLNLFDVYMSN